MFRVWDFREPPGAPHMGHFKLYIQCTSMQTVLLQELDLWEPEYNGNTQPMYKKYSLFTEDWNSLLLLFPRHGHSNTPDVVLLLDQGVTSSGQQLVRLFILPPELPKLSEPASQMSQGL